jgi:hypothetical protein
LRGTSPRANGDSLESPLVVVAFARLLASNLEKNVGVISLEYRASIDEASNCTFPLFVSFGLLEI